MEIKYKILNDREKRINLLKDKIRRSENFFITIKGNICGDDKNIKETNILLPYFLQKVVENFDVVKYEKILSFDGNYYIVEIIKSNYIKVKEKLINIESTNLGRFIDLDLYCNEEKSISRDDLKVIKRKCIVCNEEFYLCNRLKKHTVEEVTKKTKDLIKGFFVEKVVTYVTESLIEEVTADPKFGLVTKVSNGKHIDMDYNTFLISIKSITPYLYEYAYEGFNINENSFKRLRKIGIKAEHAMFKETKGVNTHKGIIFLMGLLIPSIVDSIYNNKEFYEISNCIKFLSSNILEDFNNINKKSDLTYGEEIFIKYGMTGIRGVAYSGLNIAFDLCEKFKIDDTDTNALVINLLLHIMSELNDTVILHNNNEEKLKFVKEKSKVAIQLGGYNTIIGKVFIENFTQKCIEEKISPGGSADIVSVVLVLMKVKKEFYKEK